jgi:hypothetical protein
LQARLLDDERFQLAMNFSTKCGLDMNGVWSAWGFAKLRQGKYLEARAKFDKCLKPTNDRGATSTPSPASSMLPAQLRVLADIVSYFENPLNKTMQVNYQIRILTFTRLHRSQQFRPTKRMTILANRYLESNR